MLIRDVAVYTTRILQAMGLSEAAPHSIGFGNERTVSRRAADCLDACTGFRDQASLSELTLTALCFRHACED